MTIPVYQPWLTDLEKKYLNEAYDSSWISSQGKFIDKAEELIADFIGTKYALVTSSGTTALHLSLRSLGLNYNQQPFVIAVPNITFIASAFAPSYHEATLIFIDIDPNTWNMDMDHLESRLKKHNIDIVMPVHLYGNPCDMDRLKKLQEKYHFDIIEDACESLGASIDGVKTGNLGDIGCFSFYGNKTLSCGEGGAITTNVESLYEQSKILRGQAQNPNKRYWHVDIGYNYRLTNIQAAILCGQLERQNEILSEKLRVSNRYLDNLKNTPVELQTVLSNHTHSYWLISIKLPTTSDKAQPILKKAGIDTRRMFYPITEMPPYQGLTNRKFPNSKHLSNHGISLPSYPTLTNNEIDYICTEVLKLCQK